MTGTKLLFIFALWTLLLDLDVAVGMHPEPVGRLDDEVGDGLLHDKRQINMGVDEETEENGQVFELQASQDQPAETFHQLQHENILVHKKNKNTFAAKPFDHSQAPEFSGGEHVGDDYAISITNQALVDNDIEGELADGAIITELDQPVAGGRIMKSPSARAAKSASSAQLQYMIRGLDNQSNDLEADNVILQPAVEFMLQSDNGLDDAGHTKQLRKKKGAHPQQSENRHADIVDSPSRIDAHYHEPAQIRKQTNADFEFAIRSSRNGGRNSGDAIDRPSELGAGHEKSDFYGKAKAGAEEVVITEEREEDKKLIPDYNLGEPIKDWNKNRQEWAIEHPEVTQEQLFILTGTQPWPCHNAEGDHLLLRCFKNKVDYSRIHGVGLFYNTALLDPHMPSFWAKLPVVRATMLAHPEVEWIWWLDADAIITDMEFSIPLHRYSAYNLVVHGWESLVFEKRSWLGLNAGSFLLRNCQWSLELLERWASMGPKAPMGDAYRHILSDFLPDRARNPTDDQAALVFLLIKERQHWAGKLRVELDFFLSGYWLELMDGFEATEERYRAMEEQHSELWELLERQGAVGKEKLVAAVGRAREQHLSAGGISVQQRRAFITHFTGCQPCSGHHNTIYSAEQCRTGLVRALNYADDQVLRTLGFHHRALHLPDVSSFPPPAPTPQLITVM